MMLLIHNEIYFMLTYNKFQFGILIRCHSVQPVKIVDPHLVASFFDNYKRVYLHTTTELENRSSWVADCSLNIQVSTELEDGICLVEHLQTQHLSISPGARVQYSFPEVSINFTIINFFFHFSIYKGRSSFFCLLSYLLFKSVETKRRRVGGMNSLYFSMVSSYRYIQED